MHTEQTLTSSSEAMVRGRIGTWVKAIRAKDLRAVMAHYTSDVRSFDLSPPLQIRGVEEFRTNYEAWFSSIDGLPTFEMRDLDIIASGDVAFSTSLQHATWTTKEGKPMEMSFRNTMGWQKIGGEWRVKHDHNSIPIEMKTGKGVFELTL